MKTDTNNSYLVTAEEILTMPPQNVRFLWEPYMANDALAALSGSSDVGKTSLLRQFATAIVLGKETFLGHRLFPKYKRVIYVSTEDNQNAVNIQLSRQLEGQIEPSKLKGLGFIFDSTRLLKNLEEQLSIAPVDAIIIDSFADLFDGNVNDIGSVRKFLDQYYRLTLKHHCAIIFLHHTGKRTENNLANKNNLIGSQGFEGKLRLVLELRRNQDSGSKRFLWVTKGNYVPDNIKKSALKLEFNNMQQFKLLGYADYDIAPIKSRKYSEEEKEGIMRLATVLKFDEKFSIDKILQVLENNFGYAPSKGTLHSWLKEEENLRSVNAKT